MKKTKELGVWLSKLGIELMYHNTLYEHFCTSIIGDIEYDALNKLYFDTCDKYDFATARGIERDTGMKSYAVLPGILRRKDDNDCRKRAEQLMLDRKNSEIYKKLVDK